MEGIYRIMHRLEHQVGFSSKVSIEQTSSDKFDLAGIMVIICLQEIYALFAVVYLLMQIDNMWLEIHFHRLMNCWFVS